MKTFLLRGVPAAIQQDGWWFDPPAAGNGGPQSATPSKSDTARPWRDRIALLALLVAVSDWLLWQVSPGLSLFAFGVTILVAACALRQGQGWQGVAIATVLGLPIVEQVQTLSILFGVLGLAIGAVWIAQGTPRSGAALARAALRFISLLPIYSACSVVDAGQSVRTLQGRPTPGFRQVVTGWAIPAGLGLIFVSLFVEANPVLSKLMTRPDWVTQISISRVFFWAGICCLIWPFLNLVHLGNRLHRPPRITRQYQAPRILNGDSVRRSLVLFNLLFATQSVTDLAYLWGGIALPEGMTYAQYAHRGAYPLLMTALLAGAFALAARPFVTSDRLLRIALIIWVLQTILLVISSGLRLDLYVETYGLTRLRLAAALWMWVVAVGLCLVIWQIQQEQTAGWLLTRAGILGLSVLWGALFVSFDQTIARYNMTHPVRPDARYMCGLGPAALVELGDYCQMRGRVGPSAPSEPSDWREWGFRDWRVLRSLKQHNTPEAVY